MERTDELIYTAARIFVERDWFVTALWGVNAHGTCGCGNTMCGSPGKHPDPRACPHGYKDASVHPEQIAAWFDPSRLGYLANANIGIAPGPSGLVIIDVDPRNGGDQSLEDLEQIAATLGVDLSTRTVTTGSGWHLYYKPPQGLAVRSRINVLPGIDVKGQDGLIAAPPSRHATGRVYEFVAHTEPVAPLPEFLLELVQHAPGTPFGGAFGGRLADDIDLRAVLAGEVRIPSGKRENTIFRLGCRLRGAGVPIEEAAETVGQIWEQQVDDRDTFSPEEAIRALRSAYERYEPDQLTEAQQAWVRSITGGSK